ncbi:histidine phosphatase family protein [Nocardia sp. NPDC050175]|uniref:histidine phosphatase family protein n=1 Tax=Nocardia sp. NPDC050175 TaxID=3364317 RepID=UPI0037A61615
MLLRHAPTRLNELGHYQGQCDPSLSDVGYEIARAAAEHLQSIAFTRIDSSPQQRAQQTAALLRIRRPTLPDRTDIPGLRERNLGLLDTQCESCIEHRLPGLHTRITTDRVFPPPGGGETLTEVHARAHKALAEYSTTTSGPALIVTHGGVLKALVEDPAVPMTSPLHAVIVDVTNSTTAVATNVSLDALDATLAAL